MCPSTYSQLPPSSQQICTCMRHVNLRGIIWVNGMEHEQLIPGYGPKEEMHFGPREFRYGRIRKGCISLFFSDYMVLLNSNNLPKDILNFRYLQHVEESEKVLHSSSRQRYTQGTLSTSVRNRAERNLAFGPLNLLSLEHKSICENKKRKKSPRRNKSIELFLL